MFAPVIFATKILISFSIFSTFKNHSQFQIVLVGLDFLTSLFLMPILLQTYTPKAAYAIHAVARGIPFVLSAAVNSWALPFLQDGGLLLVGLWACDVLVPILLRTDKWQGVLIVALGLCAFVWPSYVIFKKSDAALYSSLMGVFSIPLLAGFHAGLTIEDTQAAFKRGLARTFVIALCLAAPFLHYGLICFVLCSPVLLIVAPLSTLLGRGMRQYLSVRAGKVLMFLFALVCATEPYWFHPTPSPVEFTSTQIVNLPKDAVWNSLDDLTLQVPTEATPMWAKAIGLPVAQSVDGPGTHPGAIRKVRFDRGEVWATVMERVEGQRFSLKLAPMNEDREFFGHWVQLTSSEFILRAVDDTHTEVIHRTQYLPRLYPRALFEPIETWAGGTLQQALLDGYMMSVTPTIPKNALRVAFQ